MELENGGVLIEFVGTVRERVVRLDRRFAVADVVVLVGVFRDTVLRGGDKLVAVVVAVGVAAALAHHRSRAADRRAAAEGVVRVVVLRGDRAVDGISHLREEIAVRFVRPGRRRGRSDRKARLEVRARQVGPRVPGTAELFAGDATGRRVVLDHVLARPVHRVAEVASVRVAVADERLRVEARHHFLRLVAEGVVGEGGRPLRVRDGRPPPERIVGERHGRRPVGVRRGGEVVPGVVGVACRHAACPGPCCEFAVIGVSIARTPPVCIELLRDESRRLPYIRGCPSSDSMQSVHP